MFDLMLHLHMMHTTSLKACIAPSAVLCVWQQFLFDAAVSLFDVSCVKLLVLQSIFVNVAFG